MHTFRGLLQGLWELAHPRPLASLERGGARQSAGGWALQDRISRTDARLVAERSEVVIPPRPWAAQASLMACVEVAPDLVEIAPFWPMPPQIRSPVNIVAALVEIGPHPVEAGPTLVDSTGQVRTEWDSFGQRLVAIGPNSVGVGQPWLTSGHFCSEFGPSSAKVGPASAEVRQTWARFWRSACAVRTRFGVELRSTPWRPSRVHLVPIWDGSGAGVNVGSIWDQFGVDPGPIWSAQTSDLGFMCASGPGTELMSSGNAKLPATRPPKAQAAFSSSEDRPEGSPTDVANALAMRLRPLASAKHILKTTSSAAARLAVKRWRSLA